MKTVFKKPQSMTDSIMHYCPGCHHGIAHRLVAEVIDQLGVSDRTVGLAPVGCSVLAYNYLNFDFQQAAHGRAPAVATGIKRASPDSVVFTYQGDGDLAAIGTSEIVHAAARGEPITVVFINNATFGMTGGQMAPTTLIGQRTTSSPRGRKSDIAGFPIRVCELLATLDGSAYVERVSVHKPANINKARKALVNAFNTQLGRKGFSLVEIVSNCPTNWGMSPKESVKWLEENMLPHYPLGLFKDEGVSQ